MRADSAAFDALAVEASPEGDVRVNISAASVALEVDPSHTAAPVSWGTRANRRRADGSGPWAGRAGSSSGTARPVWCAKSVLPSSTAADPPPWAPRRPAPTQPPCDDPYCQRCSPGGGAAAGSPPLPQTCEQWCAGLGRRGGESWEGHLVLGIGQEEGGARIAYSELKVPLPLPFPAPPRSVLDFAVNNATGACEPPAVDLGGGPGAAAASMTQGAAAAPPAYAPQEGGGALGAAMDSQASYSPAPYTPMPGDTTPPWWMTKHCKDPGEGGQGGGAVEGGGGAWRAPGRPHAVHAPDAATRALRPASGGVQANPSLPPSSFPTPPSPQPTARPSTCARRRTRKSPAARAGSSSTWSPATPGAAG